MALTGLQEATRDYLVPLEAPSPDAARFVAVIKGEVTTEKPPFVEYLVDPLVMKPIVTELLGRKWVDFDWRNPEAWQGYLDNFIEFWLRMGYDCVRFEMGLPFTFSTLAAKDTAPGTEATRNWSNEHRGPIMSWEDFENYPWPKLEDFDWRYLEYVDSHLPEGMGLLSCHAAGVLEHLEYLMSYEGLAFALHDDRALVKAVTDKLGGLLLAFHEEMHRRLPHLTAAFQGDDMGFKTATLISPDDLRTFILPWHKRFAEVAHAAGKPYYLHSCGNVLSIMDDLIEDVKIDAKHSFEDAIIPVTEFQARYGDRIGVLGGVDVDILTRGTPGEVRAYVRAQVDMCHSRGRYAVGSGNSIPSYIPVLNYLTMLDEALR